MCQREKRKFLQDVAKRLQHPAHQRFLAERIDFRVRRRKKPRAVRPIEDEGGAPAAFERPVDDIPGKEADEVVVVQPPDRGDGVQAQRQGGIRKDRKEPALGIAQLRRGERHRRPVIELRQRPIGVDLIPIAYDDRSAGPRGHAQSH